MKQAKVSKVQNRKSCIRFCLISVRHILLLILFFGLNVSVRGEQKKCEENEIWDVKMRHAGPFLCCCACCKNKTWHVLLTKSLVYYALFPPLFKSRYDTE